MLVRHAEPLRDRLGQPDGRRVGVAVDLGAPRRRSPRPPTAAGRRATRWRRACTTGRRGAHGLARLVRRHRVQNRAETRHGPTLREADQQGSTGIRYDMSISDEHVTDIFVGYIDIMRFVGRQRLRTLEEWWDEPNPRPALLWGRRRVGKTALLQHFAQDKRAIFHTGGGRTAHRELAELSSRVASTIPSPTRDLVARPYQTWDEALDHLGREAADDRSCSSSTSSPSYHGRSRARRFPSRVPRPLSRAHAAALIVCGSAVRTMRSIQEYRAPLYGRFD